MKRTFLFLLLVAGSGSLVPNPVRAHHTHKPTVTDRPDAAEATSTVGPHHFQIETSVGYSQDKDEDDLTRIFSFPTLLRYGIGNRLEIRTEGELVAIRTTDTDSDVGMTDQAFGAKLFLIENKGILPALSFLANVSMPTGRNIFSANGFEPLFKILTDWAFPADFSFAANNGFDVPVRDTHDRKYARYLYAASVGHPMPIVADKWNIFMEMQGAVAAHPRVANEHTVDTGFTFRLTNDIQLDSFVQIGIVEAAADFTTGVGFSWRSL